MDALSNDPKSHPAPADSRPALWPGLPFPKALRLSPLWLPALIVLVVMIAAGLINWLEGRWLICDCGTVQLWAGKGHPDGSSQHIADWYTPSHLLHGFLFFGLGWLLFSRWSFGWRLAIATFVEAAWEVVENMPFIIDRYRQVTVSKDYNGDTVINTMADIGIMLVGFYLASRLPVWASLAIVIFFELLTLWLIRDGLALNILMLLWPIPALADWQAGA